MTCQPEAIEKILYLLQQKIDAYVEQTPQNQANEQYYHPNMGNMNMGNVLTIN